MDWIKLSTDNILYSEYSDWENYALIKYQALYCQLEQEPTEAQIKRVLSPKEIKFVQSCIEVITKLCQNDIEVVKKKRGRDKLNYRRKKGIHENSASGKIADRQLSDVTDKIRVDKRKEIYKENKLEEFRKWNWREDEIFQKWRNEKKYLPSMVDKNKEAVILYCESRGKTYTNYVSALQSFLNKDGGKK